MRSFQGESSKFITDSPAAGPAAGAFSRADLPLEAADLLFENLFHRRLQLFAVEPSSRTFAAFSTRRFSRSSSEMRRLVRFCRAGSSIRRAASSPSRASLRNTQPSPHIRGTAGRRPRFRRSPGKARPLSRPEVALEDLDAETVRLPVAAKYGDFATVAAGDHRGTVRGDDELDVRKLGRKQPEEFLLPTGVKVSVDFVDEDDSRGLKDALFALTERLEKR